MLRLKSVWRFIQLSCCIYVVTSCFQCQRAASRKQYSMYVWTTGFDRDVSGCGEAEFMTWNSHGHCFTHVWDTAQKRSWLWATCNLPGREVSAIYISDVHHNLKAAYDTGNCKTADITTVKQMILEGHTQVANLKIYGLYAVSDIDVTEKDLVKYIVHYNDVCAANSDERFDGVATNNEAYAQIKCGDMTARLTYLDNLQKIVTEARKQTHGTLLTHYSVSWHWGQCNGSPSMMTWNGKTSDVSHHMIDIFDSIDVQVGYIIHPQIADRMRTAGYAYAVSLNKQMFTTVYTNRESPCQITFFPDDACHIKGHNETAMFAVFDEFAAHGIGSARPCIHYFRGVYSTGVVTGWPAHKQTGSPIVG